MTKTARDEIIARVLEREGGVKDVGDGKGLTRYGQTPGWLQQFNLRPPSNASEAADNYATWLSDTRLDRVIGDAADTLADAVIDWAVHSGHVTPVKALQVALGVTADGAIGPGTLAALATQDRRALAAHVIAARAELLGRLVAGQHGNVRFIKGWMNRLGEHIRALGA